MGCSESDPPASQPAGDASPAGDVPASIDTSDVAPKADVLSPPDVVDVARTPDVPSPPDVVDVARTPDVPSPPDVVDVARTPDVPSPPDVVDVAPRLDVPSPPDVVDVASAPDAPSPPDVTDAPACASGFADCDRNPSNGCEASLATPASCGACRNVCAAGADCIAGACLTLTAPRLVAPLSTATVTSRRPALRWAPATGTDGARVQLCRDRACAMVIATLDATGTSARPTADLPPGVVFWRAFGRLGTAAGTTPGPTWEMIVGVRSAPVSASHGTTLDLNGDGYADLAVGGPRVAFNTGRVYVYPGSASGMRASPSTTLTGPDGGGYFGISVASAGDVNGDGYADLIVGASGFSTYTGRAYVYLGSASGVASSPAATLRAPDAPGGFFGFSVASVGDVNADGYADVVVGAYSAGSFAGRAYVYLGSAGGLGASPATTLTGPDGADGHYGASVASAGDVNADGYADLVVGASMASARAGRAYLYLGSASGIGASPTVALGGPDGEEGNFGGSVASAGDLNGDGYTDLIVSAREVTANTGRVYVYPGGAAGVSTRPTTTLAGPDGPLGSFGALNANGGDLNADGYSDLVVGAACAPYSPTVGCGAGRAHVYPGSASGVGTRPVLTITGPDGVGSGFGGSIVTAGDANADGYADLVVGASGVDTTTGRVYLFVGSASGVGASPTTTLSGPDGTNGSFGLSVASLRPKHAPGVDLSAFGRAVAGAHRSAASRLAASRRL